MSAIEWTVVDPDTIERIIAVGLCRRFKHARRVKASVGDGGLDVLVPAEGQSNMVVENYQVKKYADGLNASRKSKIKASLKQAIATHNDAESGYEISKWHLTLPMDLTREQEEWLVGIAKDLEAPFPVEVFGLTPIEELLSGAPEIRDYYLGDGLERVDAALARLGKLADTRDLAADPRAPKPPDATESLRDLHQTINAIDPHFVYDLEVSESQPQLIEAPGRIASVVEWHGPGTPHVTWHIATKYDAALEDRPIPGSFKIDYANLTPEQREALRRWHEYGAPVTIAGDGIAEFDFDLPGGLATTPPTGSLHGLTLGPAAALAPPKPTRAVWVIEDGAGNFIAKQTFDFQLVSEGMGGGQHRRATSADGSITVDLYTKQTGPNSGSLEAKVEVDASVWVGQQVHGVLPTIKFAAAWAEGNQLRPQDEFGFKVSTQAVPLTGEERFPKALVDAVEQLVRISDATRTPIMLPDDPIRWGDRAPVLELIADALSGQDPQVRVEGLVLYYEDAPDALASLVADAEAGHLVVPWPVRFPLLGQDHVLDLEMVITGDFSLDPASPSSHRPEGQKAVQVASTQTTVVTIRRAEEDHAPQTNGAGDN